MYFCCNCGAISSGVRLEEFIYEKVQGKKPQDRLIEDDVLGQHMLDAGNDFGSTTPYGMAFFHYKYNIVMIFRFQRHQSILTSVIDVRSDYCNAIF